MANNYNLVRGGPKKRSGVTFPGWSHIPASQTLLCSQARDTMNPQNQLLWFKCQGQLAQRRKLVAEQVSVQMDALALVSGRPTCCKLACSHNIL